MINIEVYLTQLIALLKNQFHDRLLYVGLQGSYLRGEATSKSDIDIMVVIEKLNTIDLEQYRFIIQSLEHFDRSCGFICGKEDLVNWNPLEICHLLHTTKDYFGELEALVPSYTEQDIRNFIKLSVNNLYHMICHRYVHAADNKNLEKLSAAYKGVFFILQNLYYLKHNVFIATKAELLTQLSGSDHAVLKRSIELNHNASFDFDECFALLFTWCQETLHAL